MKFLYDSVCMSSPVQEKGKKTGGEGKYRKGRGEEERKVKEEKKREVEEEEGRGGEGKEGPQVPNFCLDTIVKKTPAKSSLLYSQEHLRALHLFFLSKQPLESTWLKSSLPTWLQKKKGGKSHQANPHNPLVSSEAASKQAPLTTSLPCAGPVS